MPDFAKKWVYAGITTTFDAPTTAMVEQWDEDEFRQNIPTESNAEGREWQGEAVPDVRIVTIPIYLEGGTRQQLRDRWEAVACALAQPAEGTWYMHSDRYVTGRVNMIRKDLDEGMNFLRATIGLRCADPYWYKNSLTTATLTGGGNSVTIEGGNRPVPVFTFDTTGAGDLTVTHDGRSFVLAITDNAQYVIDCGTGTVTQGGVDALALMTGEFIEEGLRVGATTIGVTLGGTLALSSGSVSYRPRWAHTA
ncbi:MAG: hypothetical protein SFU56_09245 [Capsulimonadales bacterium]|nr:hypothetical protein [Capsulimonadales bacterium]